MTNIPTGAPDLTKLFVDFLRGIFGGKPLPKKDEKTEDK